MHKQCGTHAPAFIFSALLHTAKQEIFYIYVQCVLCRKINVFPCGFGFFLTLTQPNPLWWGSFLPTCDYFGKWPPSFFLLLFLCECFLATILAFSQPTFPDSLDLWVKVTTGTGYWCLVAQKFLSLLPFGPWESFRDPRSAQNQDH